MVIAPNEGLEQPAEMSLKGGNSHCSGEWARQSMGGAGYKAPGAATSLDKGSSCTSNVCVSVLLEEGWTGRL